MTGKYYKVDDPNLSMNEEERHAVQLLVIEPDSDDRQTLREALSTFGFGSVNCQNDHIAGMKVFQERPFTHVLYSARMTNMPVNEFLIKILTIDPQVIALPTSATPAFDDVFDMLRVGARGFVVKPYSADGLEHAILMATKAEAFSEAILNARDRNEAFSALQAASLDKLATVMRQARVTTTAKHEIPQQLINFKSSVQLSRTFAKGGEEELLDSMVEFFTKISEGPASRLGRLRKRLKNKRITEDDQAEIRKDPVRKYSDK